MIIFPPPTKFPNVTTTFPGFPVVRISLVELTLREILKIVVNNKSVGKKAISKISFMNMVCNIITSAIEILNANNISKRIEGIGTMKNTTAALKK